MASSNFGWIRATNTQIYGVRSRTARFRDRRLGSFWDCDAAGSVTKHLVKESRLVADDPNFGKKATGVVIDPKTGEFKPVN